MPAGLTVTALDLPALVLLTLLLEGAPQRLYAAASGARADLSWRILSGLAAFAAGAGALALASASAPNLAALAGAMAACACAAIVFSDVRYFLIPDLCTAAILAAAILDLPTTGLVRAALGAAVGALMLLVVIWIGRLRGVEAMGFGDVKLTFALGALLGPQLTLWALCGSSLLGLAWALIAFAARRRFDVVPFGALLASVGAALVLARTIGLLA